MPANPKYLSSGPDRAAKITAGLFGGYLLSAMLHYVLGLLVENKAAVVATSVYTLYMLWMVFFIIPFMMKSGAKAWVYYLVAIVLLVTIAYLIR
ncbi:MAG: hypothetical protein JJ862_13965 [Roseivirga sp.]|uniref:hypothetical protein n=1 Tax=Roseivirga sp. TaxID=1964215 RepID=UPI001B21D279|nr:hypothetical protein [Roseivirga sp.]MBO6662009.1 hypothetical protein [Roseivirga sp.]MBO6909402.1 hypothetical protein [Roseivirga sp.]